MGSVSALGNTLQEISQSYVNNRSYIFVENTIPQAKLSKISLDATTSLQVIYKECATLDSSVLSTILAEPQKNGVLM